MRKVISVITESLLVLCIVLSISCNSAAAESYQENLAHYTIDESSAWWNREARVFGACVTDNYQGTYDTITYQVFDSDSSMVIYESKNNGGWVEIAEVPVTVCNADRPLYTGYLFDRMTFICAKTLGYERMF